MFLQNIISVKVNDSVRLEQTESASNDNQNSNQPTANNEPSVIEPTTSDNISPKAIQQISIEFPVEIHQTWSTSISDLNNDCLRELFSNFSLLDWVIVLRVVCQQWYNVLQPMCVEMFGSLSSINSDQLAKKGQYFFKRFHFDEHLSAKFLSKSLSNYPNNAEQNDQLKIDRFTRVFTEDLEKFEWLIQNYVIDYFGKQNVQLLVLHLSNYWESNKSMGNERSVLVCISIFGYVTGLSVNSFSEIMSRLIKSIHKIRSTFDSKNLIKKYFITGSATCPILDNYFKHGKLCPLIQICNVHFSGKRGHKLCAHLHSILHQMRPLKLIKKKLLPEICNLPWNDKFDIFRFITSDREHLLPYLWQRRLRIDALQINVKDYLKTKDDFVDFVKLWSKICGTVSPKLMIIEHVTLDCQSLIQFAQNIDQNTVCEFTQLSSLSLCNVKIIYPTNDKDPNDGLAATQNELCSTMSVSALARLFPNIDYLYVTSTDETFVCQVKKCLQMFTKLKHLTIGWVKS